MYEIIIIVRTSIASAAESRTATHIGATLYNNDDCVLQRTGFGSGPD